jgi:hypothetical protein
LSRRDNKEGKTWKKPKDKSNKKRIIISIAAKM